MNKHKRDMWMAVALTALGLCQVAYFATMRDMGGVSLGAWVFLFGAYRFWPVGHLQWWFAGMAAVAGVSAWLATTGGV